MEGKGREYFGGMDVLKGLLVAVVMIGHMIPGPVLGTFRGTSYIRSTSLSS